MNLPPFALRCGAHLHRHLAAHALAGGLVLGGGGVAVSQHYVPHAVQVACPSVAAVPGGDSQSGQYAPNGAVSPAFAGTSSDFLPAAFVTPIPNSLFGSPAPDGVPVIRVDEQQQVPAPSWGMFGMAGSIAATTLIIAWWPRR
jgi:hypothetical protein